MRTNKNAPAFLMECKRVFSVCVVNYCQLRRSRLASEENLESASRSGEAGFAGEADHVVVANSDEAILTGAGALRFGLQQPSDRYTVEIVTNCVIFVSCLSFFLNSSYDRSNHLVTKNKDNPVSNVCLAGFHSE